MIPHQKDEDKLKELIWLVPFQAQIKAKVPKKYSNQIHFQI